MREVFVNGYGVVSPAGWGIAPFREALERNEPLPTKDMERPGRQKPFSVRHVRPPDPRPSFLAHPRLRRASTLTQFAVGAALEALGGEANRQQHGRVGIIVCVLSGCVNYSRRFYDEALKNPATASPLLFPETVFNAPASHLGAFLGSTAINYTCVGDAGTFLSALALGAQWLAQGRTDSCLIVGTEELDWLTADALRLFDRKLVPSEGAGAVLLSQTPSPVRLAAVTDEFALRPLGKACAFRAMRESLGMAQEGTLVVTSGMRGHRIFKAEEECWPAGISSSGLVRPKEVLGEGLMAAAAWQCVFAIDALMRSLAKEALVTIMGLHQHAIGAKFELAS